MPSCARRWGRAAPFPHGVLVPGACPPSASSATRCRCSPPVVAALAAGRVPVVAPLARGPLNVNGDEAAAALAVGLGAERLVFVSDVPGVLVEGEVATALAADEAERLARRLRRRHRPEAARSRPGGRLGVPAEIGATAVTA